MKNKLLIGLVTMISLMILLTGVVSAQSYDFSGKMVTFVDQYLDNYEEEGLFPERKAKVMDEFNVEFQTVTTSGWSNPEGKIARLLAGESTYDIWSLNEWMYFPILEMGGFYPLDDALAAVIGAEPYSDYVWSVQQKRKMLEHQGVNYAMFANTAGAGSPTIFNKDILEEQGLPNPYDLWENGEWTWENYMKIAEAATIDTNGDGEIDQWGLHNRSWHIKHLNQPQILKEEDGKYVFDPGEKLVEALQLGQELYQSGVRQTDNELERFRKGEILFSNENIWKLSRLPEDFRYGLVPPPKMPSADSHITIQVGSGFYAVPVNAAQPEALVAVFHALFKKGDLEPNIENQQMTYAQDPIAAKVIETAALEYPIGYRWLGYPFLSGPVGDIEGVVWSSDSPAERIESVKSEAQEIVDKMLNFDSAFSE